jgi:hypothetical protein
MEKNAFKQQNERAFRIISSLVKSNKVKYFSVNTTTFEYTIEKLNNGIFSIGKETGYDLIKTTVEGEARLLDIFNKSLITEILILKDKRTRRGSRKVYSLDFSENKNSVLDDIRMQPKQIYLDKLHNECPICLEPLTNNVCKPLNSDCDHYFHCNCLRNVRPNRHGDTFCPICRAEMYDIEGPFKVVNNKFGKKREKRGTLLKTLVSDLRKIKKA